VEGEPWKTARQQLLTEAKAGHKSPINLKYILRCLAGLHFWPKEYILCEKYRSIGLSATMGELRPLNTCQPFLFYICGVGLGVLLRYNILLCTFRCSDTWLLATFEFQPFLGANFWSVHSEKPTECVNLPEPFVVFCHRNC